MKNKKLKGADVDMPPVSTYANEIPKNFGVMLSNVVQAVVPALSWKF
jgi:hypothetical protein